MNRCSRLWDYLGGEPLKYEQCLGPLKMEMFIASALIAIIFLFIAWIVANLIPWESGVGANHSRKRKIAWIIIGIIATILLFVLNNLTFEFQGSQKVYLSEQIRYTNMIALIISALVYFIGGYLLARFIRKSAFGSIFTFSNK